ncbi:protein of unknown function DUF1566 [Pseudoalteromonas luteoviolacea B = ATCC 29581]|nr:protein of unknown function DUF1566 [Pseudoalteromonas luteoviolacea B = ATCC 29581]
MNGEFFTKLKSCVFVISMLMLGACGYSPVESSTNSPSNPNPEPTQPVETELPTLVHCNGECQCEANSTSFNDTGVIFWGDNPTGNLALCNPLDPTSQDCTDGRDSVELQKIGSGDAGFDFSKIDQDGSVTDTSNWSCVLDNHTGLMWEVKQSSQSGQWRDAEHSYTWTSNQIPEYSSAEQGLCSEAGQCDTQRFLDRLNSEKHCGFDDWRLPTKVELQDLVNYGQFQPSITAAFFPNALPRFYWSSTIDADDSKSVWAVGFSYGRVAGTSSDSPKQIRAVRSHSRTTLELSKTQLEEEVTLRQRVANKQRCNLLGRSSAPIVRYKQNSAGDVYDRVTGLIWKRCLLGQSGVLCEEGTATKLNWENALAAAVVENETNPVGTKWRLPNIKELQSNSELQCEEPPLNPFAFPNVSLDNVWSSTPHPNFEDSTYHYQYQNGIIFYGNRAANNFVHLVRDCG